ncbi:MAG: ABC transporter substrate-binding protein [Acidobacteriota bacterium]
MREKFFCKMLLVMLLNILLIAGLNACEKKDDSKESTTNTSTQSNTIKIGEYGALTGRIANFGISTKNGVKLAQEEYNKAGGLLGKQIEVIVEDDRSQQQEAKSAVQKLIDKDRVIAVLGEVASTNSIAGGTVCQEKGIPMISPSSTNPKVTQIGDHVFRVCFIDTFQGEVMARFAATKLGLKKVAILHDNGSDYSVGLRDQFTKTFKELGGEILLDEAYQQGDPDFNAQLTKIRALKPEAIYVPGYYDDVGKIAVQSRSLGIKVPLLGGDGWDSPALLETDEKKQAFNGCYISNHYSVEDQDPDIQKFVNTYKAKYGIVPDALAALGYDAARILFEAIKKAGSTDSKAIRDAIAQTKDFKGVTGTITIGPKRDAVKPAVIIAIENGNYKLRDKIQPSSEAVQASAGQ